MFTDFNFPAAPEPFTPGGCPTTRKYLWDF